MLTEQASQESRVPATMVPPESTSTTVTTGGVDTQKYRKASSSWALHLRSSATVDGKLQLRPTTPPGRTLPGPT